MRYQVKYQFSLSGFIRGIKSMKLYAGFDWYWKFGPFIHWTDPQEDKSAGAAFHFEKAGIGIGPFWFGVKDRD